MERKRPNSNTKSARSDPSHYAPQGDSKQLNSVVCGSTWSCHRHHVVDRHIWSIYGYIWPIYGHIWPIYGPYMAIYGPYKCRGQAGWQVKPLTSTEKIQRSSYIHLMRNTPYLRHICKSIATSSILACLASTYDMKHQ